MVYNFITYLKKLNLNKVGTLFFRIGIFLLPSAFFISAILFLLSLVISFFNNSSRLFNDKWNYLFYISFIFMIISSLIHLINYPNNLIFYFFETFKNSEGPVYVQKELQWNAWQSFIGLVARWKHRNAITVISPLICSDGHPAMMALQRGW